MRLPDMTSTQTTPGFEELYGPCKVVLAKRVLLKLLRLRKLLLISRVTQQTIETVTLYPITRQVGSPQQGPEYLSTDLDTKILH